VRERTHESTVVEEEEEVESTAVKEEEEEEDEEESTAVEEEHEEEGQGCHCVSRNTPILVVEVVYAYPSSRSRIRLS
jgi:hypothetical protein